MIKMQIEFKDGPIQGMCHELEPGWPIPNVIGIPGVDDEGRLVIYFYQIEDDYTAFYIKTGDRRGN